MAVAGALSMLYTATISNVPITKTLICGGAGLNVLSVEMFDTLQVPYDQLLLTKPFLGVTDGSMMSLEATSVFPQRGRDDTTHRR